jgi:SAM-dependent methyltransferase
MATNQQIVTRDCPACGRSTARNRLLSSGSEEWPIRMCNACGFVYLERAPVYERLVEEFAWEKTSEQETLNKQNRNPHLQDLSSKLKRLRKLLFKRNKLPWLIERHVPDGEVLDIGCAGGGLLATLPERLIPCGIEVSRRLADDARKLVAPRGGEIIHDNALNGTRSQPAGRFSGVIMSAFLEHEVDPAGLLKETHRVLRKNGVVIIKVPNWGSWNRSIRKEKWCGIRLPDHVNYFTPITLERMIRAQGLKPVRFNLPDRLPTSDNMWIVAERSE